MAPRTKPTYKQRAFARAYVEAEGNGTEAVIKAGYKVKSRAVAKAMAPRLLATPVVQQETESWQAFLERSIAPSLQTIDDLRKNCPDPRVKLAASKDLLSRAGVGKAQDKKTIVAVFAGMDEAQLLEKMARLTGAKLPETSENKDEVSHNIPCATQENQEKSDGVQGSDAPAAN